MQKSPNLRKPMHGITSRRRFEAKASDGEKQ